MHWPPLPAALQSPSVLPTGRQEAKSLGTWLAGYHHARSLEQSREKVGNRSAGNRADAL